MVGVGAGFVARTRGRLCYIMCKMNPPKRRANNISKNISEVLHGTCVDLSFEGKGVVKVDGETYFVPGIFPGEEGDISFDYARAGAKFGRVVK